MCPRKWMIEYFHPSIINRYELNSDNRLLCVAVRRWAFMKDLCDVLHHVYAQPNNILLLYPILFWNEVRWGEVRWSEVKWSKVKWSEVTLKFLGTKVPCTLGWPYSEGTWLYCDYFIWCESCNVVVLTCFVMCGVCMWGFVMCGCVYVGVL